MKKAAGFVLFLMLFGFSIAVPSAVAMGQQQEPDNNEAVTQDQNAVHSGSAAFKKLGAIQVGPSASGEAVRILSTAYTLRPITRHECRTCLG